MPDEFYPMETALAAMAWPTANRYRTDRAGSEQKVFAVDLGEREIALDMTVGLGRGHVARLSAAGIAQAAIALRLIDCGCDVAQAYRIGAAFAYQGDMQSAAAVTFGGDAPAPLDPALDRPAGKLFGAGRTLLIWSPGKALADWRDAFKIVSTADPSILASKPEVVPVVLSILAGGNDSSAPRVMIDLSALCAGIAERLGASAKDLFGWKL